MPARVQTKSEVKATLDSLGIRPQRRFGQHFLIDGNLMRGLVRGAEIAAEDAVLEVGAGTGGLTDLLADSAAQVVSVEIDRALAEHLRRRFADRSKVRVLEGDALRNKNRLSDALTEAVRELSRQASGRCMLVANLPYNIATPLILNAPGLAH